MSCVEPMETSLDQKLGQDEYVVDNPPDGTLNAANIDVSNPPKVSFCIPTLNNERTLNRCLESIARQNYPEIEMVIVDGNSSDATLEIAEQYTNKIYYDDGPLGSARQTGIEHSNGEIVAMFDSDIVIPHKSWLLNAVRYFNYSESVSTIWPANKPPVNASWVTRLYFDHWDIVTTNRIRKRRGLFGGGNSLFLRKFINSIGGVNRSIHWGEDFDWALRLRNRGLKVVFLRDPLYHDTMRTFGEFARKQFVGASTFTETGFQLMNLGPIDVFYEQFILGLNGMLTGLLKRNELYWSAFPLFLATKSIAYGCVLVRGRVTMR